MALQQFYISWREFVINRNYRGHPDDFFAILYPQFTYIGKGWMGSGNDTRHIAILEYNDSVVTSEEYDGLMAHGKYFDLFELTVSETVDILNTWYPAPDGEDPYFVRETPQSFNIIDNRPNDDIL